MRRFALLFFVICAGSPWTDAVAGPDVGPGSIPLDSWTLGGKGRRVEPGVLEVIGDGSDSSAWHGNVHFQPGMLYRFQAHVRRPSGTGTVVAGPEFANHDYSQVPGHWTWIGHVFRTPDRVESGLLRVGHWQATGTVQFDAVRLTPVVAVHRLAGGLLLGEGETIRNRQYEFRSTFDHEGGNYHRTLESASAAFNSNRWCFGGDSRVTYRFALPGHRFLSGEVEIQVGYHVRGGCLIEVSRDRTQWHAIATQESLGTCRATVPPDMVPAEVLYVRLRSSARNSTFQVHELGFHGSLDGTPPEGTGKTEFADVHGTSPELAIQRLSLSDLGTEGRMAILLEVKNTSPRALVADCRSEARCGERTLPPEKHSLRVPAGQTATWPVAIPTAAPGRYEMAFTVQADGGAALRATMGLTVPDYYRTDYGELLDDSRDVAVWWCDAAHKIPRRRSAPKGVGSAAKISAARHDFEVVQFVVRPKESLRGLTASMSPLTGPQDHEIPAEQVQVLRVRYHMVDHPTDATGLRDLWPDALPPLTGPIDVPAGENQPLWIVVHVPRDAKAGDYTGWLWLQAGGWSAKVPLRLHVWDFTLPDETHLQSGYGLSLERIARYHQLKTEADKRRVFDMYLQSFADHRMSPYQPAPLDPIRVKLLPGLKPPRAEVDFSAFDAAMARALEKFHFNSFVLPVEGMGGGTFQFRSEPKIGEYGEDTPEYKAVFSSYVRQLEEHLRAKGWLKMAYIYWFDEPDLKDFAFVRNGMERLHRYAPGLTRMLTKEPRDTLPGCVDLWCPVSPQYDHKVARERRAHGERFWWYVCCGPKAPYCTLFIDHPATELRIWHWQTWQRGIVGTLVWETNYWTSPTAFPDKPQNPYEDPMGYVGDSSLPPGTKHYWGNGDGRFLYPPESAAVPGFRGPKPVIEPPVSSIRWEMLREGVEDHEYLCLLRDRIAQKRGALPADRLRQLEALLEVPTSITTDMTTFTTDPAPIYVRRAQIAEAIEALSR